MNEQLTIANRHAERDAFLKLSLVPGVGPKILGELIEQFGSAREILKVAPDRLRAVPGVGTKLARQISLADENIDVDQQLEICKTNDIEILDRTSQYYPRLLAEIHDPPNILFLHNRLLEQDSLAIAIVGSRHATHYGKRITERLARGLAMAGFTIVSGLARGIDSAAHRGALSGGGRTLAVLGSGLLNIYPSENEELALAVRNHGAILSEHLPNSPPKSGAFPQRNRIITGLCLGTIIVEAAERSGALISARLAMEQGREVFAVPGQVDSRMSRGCHKLIRDGATLVETVDDVLQELGPLATPMVSDSGEAVRHPAELKLNDQETLVLQSIDLEPTEIDDIVQRTQLPINRVLSTISILEIRRLVRRVSGTSLVRL